MIKAIETHYKGYRFRSRLEARWAVFFDALGLEWEYELGGFELPSGRYLPDFWLPQVAMWAEVKPIALDTTAETKLRDLVEHTQNGALKLVGAPDFRAYDGFEIIEFHGRPWEIMETDFVVDASYVHEHRLYACTGHDKWPDESYFDEVYRNAVYAARSARFEFGENGAKKDASLRYDKQKEYTRLFLEAWSIGGQKLVGQNPYVSFTQMLVYLDDHKEMKPGIVEFHLSEKCAGIIGYLLQQHLIEGCEEGWVLKK